MSDDGTIRIGTEIDVSNLRSGMAEAQATVRASCANMEDAYERLAAATVAYTDQSVALRQTIRLLAQSEAERAIALKTLPSVLREQTAAADALKAAKAALATTDNAATAAINSQTAAVRSNISAVNAANMEMRVLTGSSMGMARAAGSLLATIPGLGAAMQSAFAVFGAVALVDVLWQVGKAAYDAFDMGGERARKMQEDVRNVTRAMDASNISLDVQIDKLQQEQAKLEHRPFNGIKLAMDEAADAAQHLIDRLDQVIDREKMALIDMSASGPQQLLGMGDSTKYEQSMLAEHSKWLGEAKTAQDALNESKSYGASLQTRLNDLQAKESTAGSNIWAWTHNYDTEIAAIQQMIAWQKQEQEGIQKSIELGKKEADAQKARDAEEAASIAKAAAREKMQQIDSSFAELNENKAALTGNPLTAGEGAAFWQKYLGTFKAGSEEAKHILSEYAKAQSEIHKQLESLKKRDAEGH